MFVNVVSLRRRAGILAAEIEETAAADAVVSGLVGQILHEAASAIDTVTAVGPVAAAMIEPATAASTEDGAVVSGVTAATYDGLATNVAMSNGNLTALHNNLTTNSGVISTAFESTGKFYFEVTLQGTQTPSNYIGIMLSTWSGVFSTTSMTTNSTSVQLGATGGIFSNGVNTGKTLGAQAVNDVYSAAIDLTNHLGWFRKNGGNWNGDASANPATGTGGVTIAAGSFAPIIRFAAAGNPTDQMTGNFGQAAFVYLAPSGFGVWPA